MNIRWELEWDKIYKQQGEVQSDILPTVRIAVEYYKLREAGNDIDLVIHYDDHEIFVFGGR